jgi:hypothetical protein
MQRSSEQNAIIHSSFDSVMVVEAYAGTGKSTTLEGFCAYRLGYYFLYFVFNKSMKTEAIEKFRHILVLLWRHFTLCHILILKPL